MGPTDKPTKAEARRMSLLADIGCFAHLLDGWPQTPAQIHHVLEGGKRLGHAYTIPLSPWHHVGEPYHGIGRILSAKLHGPSLALEPQKFAERYGTELQLVELADFLVAWLDEDCTRSTLMVRPENSVVQWHLHRIGRLPAEKGPRRKWQRKSVKSHLAHGAT